ncbi:hypothetical protein AUJ95_01945 [Candidatus Desantisbacteria bacterium CG2_30_40_21]|uniref:Probable pectate lyase C n=3 Tax=unclassified Candidatus Desantisiibacteriota TaxID=3106372 RepID=A0A1J5E1J6_9BACT|nr:MAG: hypothetical protein AUJ95_01945 [Candidatus Desantisbacteria bacterium CG2_30_40_21]
MLPATGKPPTVNIRYPSSTNFNAPTYANSRTFPIITSATDSESGVKDDSYIFSVWLKNDTQWGNEKVFATDRQSVIKTSVFKDGLYAFRTAVYDLGGNKGYSPIVYLYVDTQPPLAPTITSPTHPIPDNVSTITTVSFKWTTPLDASGIDGYSYDIDHLPATIPDETVDIDGSCVERTFSKLANGTWSFHLRAKDYAGNWSGTATHYTIQIKKAAPLVPQWLKINNTNALTLSCDKYASYTLTCNSSIPGSRVNFLMYYDKGMSGVLDSGDEVIDSFFIEDNSLVDEDATPSKIQITRLVPEGYTGTLTIQTIDANNDSSAFCLMGLPQRVLPQFISGRVSGNNSQNSMVYIESMENMEKVKTAVDNNGKYKAYLPPGRYRISVEVASFLFNQDFLEKEVTLLPDHPISNVDFEVIINSEVSLITGRVTDDTGKGIVGAAVYSPVYKQWVYTDANGDYTLYVTAGGIYSIYVDAFGYSDGTEYNIAAGSTVNFILTSCTATITGTVTDKQGNGILGAEVNWTATTNRFGHYCLYVSKDAINYSVSAKGIDSAISKTKANAGAANVNIQLLYHNAAISGRAYEPDGVIPLGGAKVYANFWSDTLRDMTVAYTKPDGNYELRVLDGCKYQISIQKDGYSPSPSKSDILSPASGVDITIGKRLPGRVTGVVRDIPHDTIWDWFTNESLYINPLSGVLIEVIKDTVTIATANTNEYGSYTITNLQEGTYTMYISRGGHESAEATITIKADKTSYNDFNMDNNYLFYVDDDVKQYANGSLKYPYNRIQQAVNDCLPSSCTVSVAEGIYNESVSINKELALIGAGATRTTITAAGLSSTNTVTLSAKASISGFKITGATRSWFNGGIGIYCIGSATSSTITNNIISGNSWNGIDCYSSVTITNNIISENNENGIYCSGSSPDIINNTISGNSKDGICCFFSSSPNIYNNIIIKNGITNTDCYGIYNDYSSPIIDYNCIWGNGQDGSNNYFGCSAASHDISTNPQFIGAGNYHLQATSPCINKGTNTVANLPETGMDGNPRILQTTVDMGAYESFYPGTITGNISYSGTRTGIMHCLVTDSPEIGNGKFFNSNNITVNEPGSFRYEMSVEHIGTCYLICWFDTDGNNDVSSGDVVGVYGSLSSAYLSDTMPVFVGSLTPINIKAGVIIPDININLAHEIFPLRFKVVTQHNNIETAGAGFGVALSIVDNYNNPIGSPTGAISISCSCNATNSLDEFSPIRPVDKTITFTNGNAFLGTFTLFDTREKPCITVHSDTISGTSSPITVNPLSVVTLRFSVPGTVTAGNAFLLGTITTHDMFGNIATYTGNKTLTYSGPGKSPTNISPSYTKTVYFNQGVSTTMLQTTLTKVETVQLRVTDGSISGTSTPVTVTRGLPERLDITSATHTITAGAVVNYTAMACDTVGNTWTVTDDTVFSSDDPLGTVSGSIYTAGKAGTWTVTGRYGSLSATATVVVTHGMAARIVIEPATHTITAGATVTYTAMAYDTAGNTWTVTADTVFSSDDPWGTVSDNVYTAGKVGTWTVIGNYGSLSVATAVVVMRGMALRVTIEPATHTIMAGVAISYTAMARDTAGNTWTVTTGTVFGSDDPWGTVSGSVYIAGKAGTWTVIGRYTDLIIGTTTIVVTHGMAAKAVINPIFHNKWYKDEPGTITISVCDKNGNLVATTTTFQLEPSDMLIPNKVTLIKGMATITIRVSMMGPVAIIASKGDVCGSISLNLLMRREKQTVGTFSTNNGLETMVVIPENTLSVDYYVTIGTTTVKMHNEIEVAGNRLLARQKILPDTMREFNLKGESDSITLPETSRVTIIIPYTDIGNENVRETTIWIYRLVYGKWERVEGEQIQDFAKNCVSVQVNAFSVFALIGETYPSDFSQLLVFPNPCKPGMSEKVNFHGLQDNVSISIYNLAGELAWEKSGITGGSTSWYGRNDDNAPVASGTYIYVITDANGNKKTGKVAVIW